MIDTIRFAFKYTIDGEKLKEWDHVRKRKADGNGFSICIFNPQLENGTTVSCTYQSNTLEGYPRLLVEFSIPNVINGNNIELVDDIEAVIPKLNSVLSGIDGLPPIDVRDGIVRRVDVCYNHHVGSDVQYLINALSSLDIQHRKTMSYKNQGVQYLSKQVTTKFYDKKKESRNALAYGILRQETTYRREAVRKLTGKNKPRLCDLTPDLLADALENDLDRLGILGRSIGTKDTTFRVLVETYGELAGMFYYGLLHSKTKLTKEIVLSATKSNSRTLDRRLQKIVEAGIPLTLTEKEEPLRVLIIDRNRRISSNSSMLVSESNE